MSQLKQVSHICKTENKEYVVGKFVVNLMCGALSLYARFFRIL
jgi:hypothetical protein